MGIWGTRRDMGPLWDPFSGHVGAQIGSIKGHIKPTGSKGPQKASKVPFWSLILILFAWFLVAFESHFGVYLVHFIYSRFQHVAPHSGLEITCDENYLSCTFSIQGAIAEQ